MNLALRSLLILLVIGSALLSAFKFAPHHTGATAFETLYMHLMPSALVTDNHAPPEEQKALVAIPLPGPLAMFGAELGEDGLLAGPVEDGAPAGDVEGAAEVEAPTAYLTLNNLTIFQIASILLCFVIFFGLPAAIRAGRGDKLTRIFTGWAMWIRDEMVYPVMGKEEGRKYLPYFLFVFFFLVFINLMGLLPSSFTPTASIFVTAGMALTTLVAMVGCGMVVQGPVKFWLNLVPHVPLALWPLMFVVELIGLMVKPFALMIRMFANLSGGHMVVLSFMGLIFFFGGESAAMGYGVAPVAIAFAVFIMIIETFVALLQAYIFTQLSILFIGASIHPEH